MQRGRPFLTMLAALSRKQGTDECEVARLRRLFPPQLGADTSPRGSPAPQIEQTSRRGPRSIASAEQEYIFHGGFTALPSQGQAVFTFPNTPGR